MDFEQCNTANYRAGRTKPVQYIVMHYAANNGDTARSNCDYYARTAGLQASAHYFVDEHVPDFNINTQGKNYADAMEMARDAIGLVGIDMEDDNE